MKKTVKELYVTGMMSVRTHNAIHKALGSMHDFGAYDNTEWLTMEDLLGMKEIKGALRSKIAAMATL